MKIVILDSSTLGEDIELSAFSEIGETVIYEKTAPHDAAERISDCDIAVLNKVKLGEEELSGAKNLKLICVAATGFDNISKEACKKRGIALCNVPGYSTDSVSQTTLSIVLALAMRLTFFNDFVQSGEYTKSGIQNCLSPTFYELAGKTWGIVGYGNIGKRVAEAARAMGCNVIAFSRTPKDGVECVDLNTLCKKSDIITLHLPLSEETRGIIGKAQLDMMKENVILVNTARGAVTDEAEVAKAVESGKIGAFGTDVYSIEPIQTENTLCRLFGRRNVIMTPHLAWGAYEARKRCIEEIISNIKAFLNGEKRNRIV